MQVTRPGTMGRGMARLGVAAGVALVVLRGIVGVVMAYHGYQKLTGGVPGFAQFVGSLGVPLATPVAYLVTFLELGGGILLILGLLTRLWASLIAIEMVFTTILVKLDVGLIAPSGAGIPGAELDLMILAACLALLVLGPGPLSLDRAFGLDGYARVGLPMPATTTTGLDRSSDRQPA